MKVTKERLIQTAAAIGCLLFFAACSTQENTWLSRHYQEMNTRFNVFFNGNEAYKKGIDQINTSFKEDYSNFLPLYKVSDHEIAKSTASSMDRAIDKSQKAIKKHSIRVKPKEKPTSKSSETYKKFYGQEEFNPFMDKVFLLMANAQFHKADFMSSSATCSYIMRHFSTNKPTSDKAAILLARSYLEMDWIYDAENTLSKLNTEKLTPSLTGDFSAAQADFLIKNKRYDEAIPYLKIALSKAHRKDEKSRWTFLLGQLYQEIGKKPEANKAFGSIPGKNPPYDMEISARIHQTEVYPENNTEKPLKKLYKLSRSSKNKDYLDQIYYAMGNLYLLSKDTAKAIESFHKSLKESTKQGPHKLKTLLVLGELYYKTENFLPATPCYGDAETIIKKEDPKYDEIAYRSALLKELEPHLKIIHDEDSLQALAKLSKKELDEVISGLVKAAIKKAKEEKRQKDTEEALNANQDEGNPNNQQNVPKTITDPTNKSWYFYNPSVVSRGLEEFRKKWGNRELADDWRRKKKTPLFEDSKTNEISGQEQASRKDTITGEKSSGVAENAENVSGGADDPLKPNFYLKDIPFTKEQLAASDAKVADGLFNAGIIFRDKMGNNRLALQYLKELEKRYPENQNLEKGWYTTFLILKQEKKDSEASDDRHKLLVKFPESPFAKRLKDSLFIENLSEMYQKQDSIYETAFGQYQRNEVDSAFSSCRYVVDKYPLSKLIPRFKYIEAMEFGRTGKPNEFHKYLVDIFQNYPESDLNPVVKEMLALWDKGIRPVPSPKYSSLLATGKIFAGEEEQRQDSLSTLLSFNPKEAHVIMIQYPADSINVNKLQFDVALYNFTTFLIRDYELSITKIGKMDVLLIQGFENAEDAVRYRSWINFQNIAPEVKYPGTRIIIASESNMKLLEEGVNPETYIEFFRKNYSKIKPNL